MSVDINKFHEVVPGPKTLTAASAEPSRAGSTIDKDATEGQLAALLEKELPPIKCVGEDWFVYEKGAWNKTNRDEFKPRALSIQHPLTQTARRAANVLSHIEFAHQCDPNAFRSFCCFGEAIGEILINCANGVLRVCLEEVRLLPHDPKYLFTGQLAASYEPLANAQCFERALQEQLPDPKDLDLFRCFSGYLLYPDCRFEVALVCYGPGGTGKSTLSGAIENVIGFELARHLSLEQICNPQSKLVAQLQHMALNVATELNGIATVGGETFKQLVSGEPIQADRKYLSDLCLRTGCKHWFNTNYLPRFRHGTDAELRRLRFLEFDRPPPAVDVALKNKLLSERDGILLLMLDGLRDLMRRNQFPTGGPNSIHTRERFAIQNDPLGSFVKNECVCGANKEIGKDALFNGYQQFCEQNGMPAPTDNRFFFKELLSRFPVQNVRRRDGERRLQKISGISLRENGDA